ncbi:MAG TPA: sulfocyanin-like copper-binding protein [Candidatus Limnocylindria bacterium]|jgi:sulfocyanin|nr:sulfocyanin-like copper-binding protein [Candidatus Limnocylindria bacterium]
MRFGIPLPSAILLTGLALMPGLHGEDTTPAPATHDPAAHTPAGIKKEMIAGITEADFLKLGDQSKTAKITLVAVFTEANHGMNFNGYSHGKAVYTIPTGWTVEVTFINPSPVPHSAIVVDRDMARKVQVGEPAFAGAAVPNYLQGLSLKKSVFTFVASEAGDYALCCGFPTHAIGGHWVTFNVRDDLKTPTLKLGEAEAREAK